MSDEVLEAYMRRVVEANREDPEGILFAWQGGEPTLMGLDFFRKALAVEMRHAAGRPVRNTLQTNGLLLDDRWCEFLARNGFLVGLSLDGPREIHDRYRRGAGGASTFQKVHRALRLLGKHGLQFNVLASVARETARHPLEVYRFFKAEGIEFIQFIPIVERMPGEPSKALGLELGTPPLLDRTEEGEVTPWTVEPDAYGSFLCDIFSEWVRRDIGKIFVMNFEWTLFAWIGGEEPVCYLARRCGNSCIVEHNGDVYSCDHYVYPEYRLGNVCTTARGLSQTRLCNSREPERRPCSQKSAADVMCCPSAGATVRNTASPSRRQASRSQGAGQEGMRAQQAMETAAQSAVQGIPIPSVDPQNTTRVARAQD